MKMMMFTVNDNVKLRDGGNLYNSRVCEIFMKTQFYHGLLEHLPYNFSGCLTV